MKGETTTMNPKLASILKKMEACNDLTGKRYLPTTPPEVIEIMKKGIELNWRDCDLQDFLAENLGYKRSMSHINHTRSKIMREMKRNEG